MRNRIVEESRIRELIGFTYEQNSHDVLSEEVLNQSVLDKENLPAVNFNKAFRDNMVGVYINDAGLQSILKDLEDHINKAEKERKKLESITIDINSGSSPENATNRLPKGVSQSDHTYGGIVPKDKWTRSNDYKGNVKDLPHDYTPNKGYYGIEGGNKFLAQNRAINLSKKLRSYFKNKYKIIPSFKINAKTDTKQFVNAEIKSVAFKMIAPKKQTHQKYIQQILNVPPGYEKSRYHYTNEEGDVSPMDDINYHHFKKYKEELEVKELPDMKWEEFLKLKRKN